MAPTTLIPPRQAQLWTKKGLGRLGFLIRQARLDLGWSMDRLALAVFHKTGEQIAKKTIGNIENNVGFPQYNSLAAIAALRIVKSSTGRPLDHHDFVDSTQEDIRIIRELVDPNGEAFDEMEWLQSANLL